jgi:hypothetical protein
MSKIATLFFDEINNLINSNPEIELINLFINKLKEKFNLEIDYNSFATCAVDNSNCIQIEDDSTGYTIKLDNSINEIMDNEQRLEFMNKINILNQIKLMKIDQIDHNEMKNRIYD